MVNKQKCKRLTNLGNTICPYCQNTEKNTVLNHYKNKKGTKRYIFCECPNCKGTFETDEPWIKPSSEEKLNDEIQQFVTSWRITLEWDKNMNQISKIAECELNILQKQGQVI